MVAGAGLLEPLEVRVEVGLGVERRPVDAREHLALRVAAPVRARHGEQLERLDPPGVRGVRAAAQVGEGPVRVQRDGVDALVADQVLDQLHLVGLVLGPEARDRGAGADVLARERLARLDVLAHLGLERGQVVLGHAHAVRELEVVVEAVLDRRADRDARAGIEVEHRRREHVRGVVADQLERLGRALGHDLDPLPVGERTREVADVAVDLDGERGAREAGADRGRQVGAGGAGVQRLCGCRREADSIARWSRMLATRAC